MITEDFKRILKDIQLDPLQIEMIEKYLNNKNGRINPDSIQYGDDSIYYSENYTKLMMNREYDRGRIEGQRAPVIHRAITVISPCSKCGHEEKS